MLYKPSLISKTDRVFMLYYYTNKNRILETEQILFMFLNELLEMEIFEDLL